MGRVHARAVGVATLPAVVHDQVEPVGGGADFVQAVGGNFVEAAALGNELEGDLEGFEALGGCGSDLRGGDRCRGSRPPGRARSMEILLPRLTDKGALSYRADDVPGVWD